MIKWVLDYSKQDKLTLYSEPGDGGTDPDYKFINVSVIVCNTKGIEYCLSGYPINSNTLFLDTMCMLVEALLCT